MSPFQATSTSLQTFLSENIQRLTEMWKNTHDKTTVNNKKYEICEAVVNDLYSATAYKIKMYIVPALLMSIAIVTTPLLLGFAFTSSVSIIAGAIGIIGTIAAIFKGSMVINNYYQEKKQTKEITDQNMAVNLKNYLQVNITLSSLMMDYVRQMLSDCASAMQNNQSEGSFPEVPLQASSRVEYIKLQQKQKLHQIGDLHGKEDKLEEHLQQLRDEGILDENGKLSETILFTGDWQDENSNSSQSLEVQKSSAKVLIKILQLKKDNPDKVYLIKGNHDYVRVVYCDNNVPAEFKDLYKTFISSLPEAIFFYSQCSDGKVHGLMASHGQPEPGYVPQKIETATNAEAFKTHHWVTEYNRVEAKNQMLKLKDTQNAGKQLDTFFQKNDHVQQIARDLNDAQPGKAGLGQAGFMWNMFTMDESCCQQERLVFFPVEVVRATHILYQKIMNENSQDPKVVIDMSVAGHQHGIPYYNNVSKGYGTQRSHSYRVIEMIGRYDNIDVPVVSAVLRTSSEDQSLEARLQHPLSVITTFEGRAIFAIGDNGFSLESTQSVGDKLGKILTRNSN